MLDSKSRDCSQHDAIVRERVKRFDGQRLSPGLNVNEAEGSHRHSSARTKTVDQSFRFFAIGDLLFEIEKSPGCRRFTMIVSLEGDPFAIVDSLMMFGLERQATETASLRERMFGRRRDFRQNDVALPKRNHMARARDADESLISLPLDRFRRKKLEELRVERSSVEVKRKFGESGTDSQHAISPLIDGGAILQQLDSKRLSTIVPCRVRRALVYRLCSFANQPPKRRLFWVEASCSSLQEQRFDDWL